MDVNRGLYLGDKRGCYLGITKEIKEGVTWAFTWDYMPIKMWTLRVCIKLCKVNVTL